MGSGLTSVVLPDGLTKKIKVDGSLQLTVQPQGRVVLVK